MKQIKLSVKHITAIVMGAAMCFAMFAFGVSFANAEETDQASPVTDVVVDLPTDELSEHDPETREELLEKIANLRALVELRKQQIQDQHQQNVSDRQELIKEKKVEFQINRAEFMASLEGLSEEEKRVAMIEFMNRLRDAIDAHRESVQDRVEEVREQHLENKEARIQNQKEFRASLEGLSKDEKIAAILERVSSLTDHLEDKIEDHDNGDNDDSEEDEMEDDSSEETDDSEASEEDDSEEGDSDESY